MSANQLEELQLQIQDMFQQVKMCVRRIEELQTDISRLNDDRQILEDLVTSVGHLKEITITGRNKLADKVEQEAAKTKIGIVEELIAKFKKRKIEPKKWWFWK